MHAAKLQTKGPEEMTRLGDEILHRKVEPLLTPADAGKFVAIDVDSEDFEVHKEDVTAIKRLLARHPEGQKWLARAFETAAYRIGRG
jgi:hypothetical protein